MATATPGPMGWPAALDSRQAKLEPYDWYDDRRRSGPVHYDPVRECWDVFSYDLVTDVLTDPETFSSVTAPPERATGLPSMLSEDPPRHTELRGAVDAFFTPGSVGSLVPDVERTADELLSAALEATGDESHTDEATDAGSRSSEITDGTRMELVDELARPLPIHTIAALLGVPADDRAQFERWSDAVIAGPALTGGDSERLERQRGEAANALASYFAEISRERRENPGEDLVSRVLAETDLTDLELLGLFRLLLVAGNVTTTNLITNALWALTETDSLTRLRDDPSLVDGVVEETLRYRSPVQRTIRRATRDVDLRGHEVAADDRVVVWLGAANRDPAAFDEPDRFRLDRTHNPHVGFGRGIHVCLGAALARIEGRIAIERLLERTETIEPIETTFEPVSSTFIYGLQRFPVSIR